MMIKYREKGQEKKLRIIKDASHKWRDIVSLICENPNRVGTLEDQYRGRHEDCLRQALVEDFINKKPAEYSNDWNGLIDLLDNVDLEALAEKVKYALTQT